jgi:CRISPR system Cascade subunit CasA
MLDRQRYRLNLPDTFRLLADSQHGIESFTAFQAHQGHAWHAFTVQIAAMICQRASVQIADRVCRDENWWRERLRELAGGDEAWTLVVDDLGEPAFMQPAIPERKLHGFKVAFDRPDTFDMLVASKNHDRKSARQPATPEAWFAALVASQTMQGYSGRANYGIFRMNGGLGNRPGIGFAKPQDLGDWFRTDVTALLASRDQVLTFGFDDHGHPLLWCLPWTGKDALAMHQLDPWCVECSRRVRLVHRDNALILLQAPTEAARVDTPQEVAGNVGDPWTPVAKADGKALTLPAEGFSYRRVQELLFGHEWVLPVTQQQSGNASSWVARTLVRGQGKTEGYHERIVPIGPRARRLLANPEAKADLAKLAKAYVQAVKDIRQYVLWPALKALAGKYSDPAEAPLTALEAAADERFFPHLWEQIEAEAAPDVALRDWHSFLRDRACALLMGVMRTAAPGSAMRWRRIAEAESRFSYGLWTYFTALMEGSRPEVHV